MSERKAPTYAANNAQIARALGLNPKKRAVLADVGRWLARKDFPKRQRNGWLISDLRAWHESFQAETPLLSPEIALQERKKSIVQLYIKGKPLEKFADDDRAVLIEQGILKGDAAPAITTRNGVHLLEKVTTQKAVLRELQRYYAGKLQNEISQQNVSDWHSGENLPDPEAPPLPHKDGNYFILARIIEWFDRWILPHWSLVPNGQQALFPAGELSRLRQENEREGILHEQFLRECERGQWLRKADLGPAIDGAVKAWCDELDKVEFLIPKGMEADLRAMTVPDELRLGIMDKLRERVRSFNDGLRRAIQEKLSAIAANNGAVTSHNGAGATAETVQPQMKHG